MTTLTPTKDLGATAKPNDVVYVDPAQQVTDELIAQQLAVDGVNGVFLADVLSAALTHERCGRHLYRTVSTRTLNPILQRQYNEFGEETEHHVEILTDVITEMGGNPNYVSSMARAVEAMDTKLVEAIALGSGGVDIMTAEMAMLDAVFIAESVDHANWQTMRKIADALPEGPLKQRFNEAVDEVEAQEDEHLEWARTTKERLTMLQMKSTMMAKAGAKAEELVVTVRNWLSDGES